MATTAQTLGGIQALSFSANCSSVQKLGDGLVRDKKMCPPARKHFQVRAMAPKKKVNAYDDAWSKQWFGAGLFAENTETESVDIVKKLEKKKLLSQVEKAGLLSKAESLGVSLSQIEKLGLLSKAEDLGLLTLAENFVTTSPASLASLSLPFIVLGIAIPILVPDSSTAVVIAQNVVSLVCLATAGGLFVGSVVLSGLQEE
ncbi:uncharacterized protein [Physcomitrium patens]|uniref:DUF1118 domain-containing protein n=1 Tax=Physcomitrium patens TaxID=3218 RepID=A0A2K1IW92_PHYPA|nr:uncharacterized protein LOC112273375 [Physcomitrium patens]PNR33546.1 hypothetical protein PHYPA_025490 [Physcomitrium patens]|eukprot:XP_024357838.1 uncharacterized protein LOC112273375 [Physcomitrella patens]